MDIYIRMADFLINFVSMDLLSVIALVLAAASLLLVFFKVVPTALSAYASIVCACFCGAGGAIEVSHDSLLFWGVATVIVLGLSLLNSGNPLLTGAARAYVSAGAIVGGLLGFAATHSAASIIMGSALGAVLGACAYSRTPSGSAARTDRRVFVDYVCAAGLPAVVIAGMCGMSASAVLF